MYESTLSSELWVVNAGKRSFPDDRILGSYNAWSPRVIQGRLVQAKEVQIEPCYKKF